MESKYYCGECKGDRKHSILFEKEIHSDEDNPYVFFQSVTKYQVIECCGCSHISFVKKHGGETMFFTNDNGEEEDYFDIDIYPQYLEGCEKLKYLHLLPSPILSIYNETVNAFRMKCLILTAGGFRAIIEAICNHLNIKKGNLVVRINELNKKGHLTVKETDRLHSIRFLGNDSLHDIQTPKKHQLIIVMEIINHLLDNLFLQDQRIDKNLEKPISDYLKFNCLLNDRIAENLENQEITLLDLLGKSKRTIDSKNLVIYEQELKKSISTGTYKYLSISRITPDGETVYKVESIPTKDNFWF